MPPKRCQPFSMYVRWQNIGLPRSGLKQMDIVNHFGDGQSDVGRILSKHRQTGSAKDRPCLCLVMTWWRLQSRLCSVKVATKFNLAPHKLEWSISILFLPCWWAHLCPVMTWWRLQSRLCSVKATGIWRICNGFCNDVLWTQDPTDYSPWQPQWYKVSRWDSGRHCQTLFPAFPGRTANLTDDNACPHRARLVNA